MLGPLRIPDLADDFVVMDADLRWVRPVAFFQFDGAGAAVPTVVWTDSVPVTAQQHIHRPCSHACHGLPKCRLRCVHDAAVRHTRGLQIRSV